jgi:uncharacterized membrane protein YcaP (DUF421 family)
LVIVTLILMDVLISLVAQRSRLAGKLIEGVPMVIVADGKPLHDRMRKARIELTDVLEAARHTQGLERMDQIKFAVVETSGGITIIPKER